jgi:2,5-dihydroxypyridine 5,6-dioxygenase
MKRVLMSKGARIIAEECANIRPQESVLIATDFLTSHIAEVLAAAVQQLGAQVVMTVMSPTKIDGTEPPASVAAAMKASDCIIMPVAKSLSHTLAVKEAIQKGARVISMTAFTEEQMIEGGLFADFRKEKPVCDRVAELLTHANSVHFTTRAGTDLSFSIKGRKGNSHCCIVTSAGFTALPNIEANISPVEGTANGVIVGDGSIPYFNIGVLTEPVIFKVRGGFVYEITGGIQAKAVSDLMAAQNDKYVYNIAQFAMGLNPLCKELTGVMLNDEGVLGTAHIGIGTSSNLGGKTKAATHFDVIIRDATVDFDGKPIMENGQLKI